MIPRWKSTIRIPCGGIPWLLFWCLGFTWLPQSLGWFWVAFAQSEQIVHHTDRQILNEYSHRFWTREHGLPENKIRCLLQSRDGYVWIGTKAGLARFDGSQFVVFDKSNTPGFTHSIVESLAEDGDGNIWIQNEGLILKFRNGECELVLNPDGSTARRVGQFGPSTRGTVFWSCDRTVLNNHGQKFSLSAVTPYSLMEESPESLWAVQEQALHLLGATPEQEKRFDLPVYDRRHLTAAFALDRNGRKWMLFGSVSENCILYQLTSDGPVSVSSPRPGNGGRNPFLTCDLQGRFWYPVGNAGLECFSSRIIHRYALPWQRSTEMPVCMLADREGNLWIGMEESGLHLLKKRVIKSVLPGDGLPHPNVRSVAAGTNGVVWAGTDNGIAICQWDDSGSITAKTNGLSGYSVRALAVGTGSVWAGTSRGLFLSQPGGFQAIPLPYVDRLGDEQHLAGLKVRSLSIDAADRLWILAPTVISMVDGRSRATRAVALFDPPPGPTILFRDRDSAIWIGIEGLGFKVYPTNQIADFERKEPALTKMGFPILEMLYKFPNLKVGPGIAFTTNVHPALGRALSVYQDQSASFWFGTDKGLVRVLMKGTGPDERYLPSKVAALTESDGLFSHQVLSMAEDDFGNYWFGTSKGIFRVRRDALNDLAEGRIQRVESISYGVEDGMPDAEVSGGFSHPSVCKSSNGWLWFPTGKGLAVLDPAAVETHETPPPSVIELVRADGEIVFDNSGERFQGRGWKAGDTNAMPSTTSQVKRAEGSSSAGLPLAPGRARVMEFSFTSPYFSAPESVRFRYQLAGYETNWHEAGKRRTAHYTNLDPGRYRFRVLAGSHHDNWSKKPSEFGFVVTPFYWQTLWFKSGCLMAFMGILLGTTRWWLNRQKQLLELTAQLEQHRFRELLARDLHDHIGSGLAQITRLSRESDSAIAPQNAENIKKLASELGHSLGDLVVGVDPALDKLPMLVLQLREFVPRFLSGSGLSCNLDFPKKLPPVPLVSGSRNSILACVKEALQNAVKHSGATQIELQIHVRGRTVELIISDNGRGGVVPPGQNGVKWKSGRGLANMQARTRDWNGTMHCESVAGQGTRLSLTFECMSDVFENWTDADPGHLSDPGSPLGKS